MQVKELRIFMSWFPLELFSLPRFYRPLVSDSEPLSGLGFPKKVLGLSFAFSDRIVLSQAQVRVTFIHNTSWDSVVPLDYAIWKCYLMVWIWFYIVLNYWHPRCGYKSLPLLRLEPSVNGYWICFFAPWLDLGFFPHPLFPHQELHHPTHWRHSSFCSQLRSCFFF